MGFIGMFYLVFFHLVLKPSNAFLLSEMIFLLVLVMYVSYMADLDCWMLNSLSRFSLPKLGLNGGSIFLA